MPIKPKSSGSVELEIELRLNIRVSYWAETDDVGQFYPTDDGRYYPTDITIESIDEANGKSFPKWLETEILEQCEEELLDECQREIDEDIQEKIQARVNRALRDY